MQVKKFEAPTLQEALETIKRELGPEAIILQTKKYKRGFGLMSRASVEVTAAISDRSMQKKAYVEKRLPEPTKQAMKKLPAEKQAQMYDKYMGTSQAQIQESHLQAASRTQDHVQVSKKAPAMAQAAPGRAKITATRYIDIDAEAAPRPAMGMETYSSRPPMASDPARAALHDAGKAALQDAGKAALQDELRHLKRMLEELKSAQEHQATQAIGSGSQALVAQGTLSTPVLHDAFEQLVINGVDKRFALSLIKKVGFELGAEGSKNPDSVLDQLAMEMMESVEVMAPLAPIQPKVEGELPKVIAIVGPTGVGKTTTVAKMASEALLRRGLKVGLINLDNYKVAAFDQLGTYAKILNVPFRSAASAEDLKAAIEDFRKLDLILVDTTGRSQRDPDSLKDMQALLDQLPNTSAHLVLSATTRDAELYDMANRFSVFRPQGVIISKLDEATIYGCIYNVSQKVKLPLLYFTTGQRVPEDIEEATRERLVSLVLDL